MFVAVRLAQLAVQLDGLAVVAPYELGDLAAGLGRVREDQHALLLPARRVGLDSLQKPQQQPRPLVRRADVDSLDYVRRDAASVVVGGCGGAAAASSASRRRRAAARAR